MSFDQPALLAQVAALDPGLRARLEAAGFDPALFCAQARSLTEGDPLTRRSLRNRVRGEVRVPTSGELVEAPSGDDAQELARLGMSLIARGGLAFCVMAGGMATRMGGVVKALVPVLGDATFLDLRLLENSALGERAGRPVPLWLMTSDATDARLRTALEAANARPHIATFTQNLSLRLTPEAALFGDAGGQPSTYAPGHGDLPAALRRSGLLEAFVAQGGDVVWITNVDNLGATVDPAIVGAFLRSGKPLMVEVCPKAPGDKGGIPVHAEEKLQILEEFRLPEGFDAGAVRVFNTNTFLVSAKALLTTRYPSTYFEVEKTVDGRPAIQFERLLQELTAHLDASYLKVSRQGAASRFEPVKDNAELAARRDAIEAIMRARGIVGARVC